MIRNLKKVKEEGGTAAKGDVYGQAKRVFEIIGKALADGGGGFEYVTRTRDILADLGTRRGTASRPVLVGFAAETDDVVRKARDKRTRKQVDLVVANDVSQSDRGFDVETNAVTIVGPDGEETLPLQHKDRIAAAIIDRIEPLVTGLRKPAAARA